MVQARWRGIRARNVANSIRESQRNAGEFVAQRTRREQTPLDKAKEAEVWPELPPEQKDVPPKLTSDDMASYADNELTISVIEGVDLLGHQKGTAGSCLQRKKVHGNKVAKPFDRLKPITDQPFDPYVQVYVRQPDKDNKAESIGYTEFVRKSLDPIWNAKYVKKGVTDDRTEVTIRLRDRDVNKLHRVTERLTQHNDRVLGEVRFLLRDLRDPDHPERFPVDGKPLILPVGSQRRPQLPDDASPRRLEGYKESDVDYADLWPMDVFDGDDPFEPKGWLRIKVAWKRKVDEHGKEIVARAGNKAKGVGGARITKDLKDYDPKEFEKEERGKSSRR